MPPGAPAHRLHDAVMRAGGHHPPGAGPQCRACGGDSGDETSAGDPAAPGRQPMRCPPRRMQALLLRASLCLRAGRGGRAEAAVLRLRCRGAVLRRASHLLGRPRRWAHCIASIVRLVQSLGASGQGQAEPIADDSSAAPSLRTEVWGQSDCKGATHPVHSRDTPPRDGHRVWAHAGGRRADLCAPLLARARNKAACVHSVETTRSRIGLARPPSHPTPRLRTGTDHR
jgi:hypothetical protein